MDPPYLDFSLLVQQDLELTISLLKHGSSLSQVDPYGSTPLHLAARRRQLDLVLIYIKFGADIHAKGEHNWTALHEAIAVQAKDVVKALLRHGARSTDLTDSGESVMDLGLRVGIDSSELTSWLGNDSNIDNDNDNSIIIIFFLKKKERMG